jgi:hypothetical protein
MIKFSSILVLLTSIASTSAIADDKRTSIYSAPPPMIKLWKNHMDSAGSTGSTWLGPIKGNGTTDSKHKFGKRNTLIYVPAGHDLNKKTDIIIWLHGHWGFNKFYKRILRHMPKIYSKGKNAIIIAPELPWSTWTRTPTKRNGTGPFKNFEEYLIWKNYVLNVLFNRFGIHHSEISKDTVIYGHSAGGSAIKSMAITGVLRDIDPSVIIFSDSTYGRWLDTVYNFYIKYHPETSVYIMTAPYGSPRRNAERFLKSIKTLGENIVHMKMSKKWTHKRIGDNCLLFSAENQLFLSIIEDSRQKK